MNPLQKIQDILNNEIQDQCFYNEQAIRITDPAIPSIFLSIAG
jgi:rubrerythrin